MLISLLSWLFLSVSALCLGIAWILAVKAQEHLREVRRLQMTLTSTIAGVEELACTVLSEEQGTLLLLQINERLQQGLIQTPAKPLTWH
jgi:hypothetical protein